MAIKIKHNNKNRHSKSTVTKAHTTSPSVRTTIPQEIIAVVGWEDGDVLGWSIEQRGSRYFVNVRRLE